jgi:hypothetical protein
VNYTLQFSLNPAANDWEDVATASGNGGVLNLKHANTSVRGFYKVKLTKP